MRTEKLGHLKKKLTSNKIHTEQRFFSSRLEHTHTVRTGRCVFASR